MDLFPQNKEERLLELLAHEKEMFEQMRGLIGEQAKLLAADDIAGFNRSLDKGQETIDMINGLHQESDDLMQSYTSYSNSEKGKKIDAIEDAAALIRELLTECAGLHQKNSAAAKEKSEEYAGQSSQLRTRRESLGLYAQPPPEAPMMFDRKT